MIPAPVLGDCFQDVGLERTNERCCAVGLVIGIINDRKKRALRVLERVGVEPNGETSPMSRISAPLRNEIAILTEAHGIEFRPAGLLDLRLEECGLFREL